LLIVKIYKKGSIKNPLPAVFWSTV
jgi:hypothetical protein